MPICVNEIQGQFNNYQFKLILLGITVPSVVMCGCDV